MKEYITHKEAIKIIAEKNNVPESLVKKTLHKLFSGGGIGKYLKKQIPITIQGFGKFKLNRKGTLLKRRSEKLQQQSHNKKVRKYLPGYRDNLGKKNL